MDHLTAGISVVIPVYNAANSLASLMERLYAVLQAAGMKFEIIFVNDGSVDESWQILRGFGETYAEVRVLNLMRNYGQHNAIICGLRHAVYAITITMDDDLQHPPEEIHSLLKALQKDHDVVYGKPKSEKHGLLRSLASKITKMALFLATQNPYMRDVSAFRIFRTNLRQGFADYNNNYVSLDVLLTWSTNRFHSIRVDHEIREVGKSNYTVGKLILHAINMMTGFSTIPLRIASLTGFTFTVGGVSVLVYVLARYIALGGSVPGFPFLSSIIAIFSGAQLFALGIIGEYLARVHYKTLSKPIYVIREQVDYSRAFGE